MFDKDATQESVFTECGVQNLVKKVVEVSSSVLLI